MTLCNCQQAQLKLNAVLSVRDAEIQTEELCLRAVKRNGMALMYVRVQTPEIVQAAINENKLAKNYIGRYRP